MHKQNTCGSLVKFPFSRGSIQARDADADSEQQIGHDTDIQRS